MAVQSFKIKTCIVQHHGNSLGQVFGPLILRHVVFSDQNSGSGTEVGVRVIM